MALGASETGQVTLQWTQASVCINSGLAYLVKRCRGGLAWKVAVPGRPNSEVISLSLPYDVPGPALLKRKDFKHKIIKYGPGIFDETLNSTLSLAANGTVSGTYAVQKAQ
ncbi:hypothetical protein QBC33DRAFT_598477 [Phialemonium atrogriseum]|uniref:Uncharacterized protein n=1 Tax=Phialemonium atrogriseum TaxID=1093897 RepID=A0AAJ0BUK1_9PEZI|nr:uncharacterized protein QBC33DRAFT_598477 [Phialemonium atrogriseum]KAK1763327.1 hypothetical protein QBC33DRAFT_598477 [Phialemonium atrogriseum]